MNGAPSGCVLDAGDDGRDARLYVARFYFYVYAGTRTDCLQHLLKCGKPDARSELEIVQLSERNRGDSAAGEGRIDRRRKQRVVMDALRALLAVSPRGVQAKEWRARSELDGITERTFWDSKKALIIRELVAEREDGVFYAL